MISSHLQRATEVSLGQWIREMAGQARALENFGNNALRAADKGLKQGLIDKLNEMGPAGALRMRQLANASQSEIAKANRAWASGQQAIRDYNNMRVETKKITGSDTAWPCVGTGDPSDQAASGVAGQSFTRGHLSSRVRRGWGGHHTPIDVPPAGGHVRNHQRAQFPRWSHARHLWRRRARPGHRLCAQGRWPALSVGLLAQDRYTRKEFPRLAGVTR